jgi:hypothetical protein
MGSLGGLDVAYGSNLQIVKTNVLCLAIASTGVSSTTAPKHILNAYKEGLKGSTIEPDFLYLYEITDTDGSGYVEATADALFDNDPANTGTATQTALENHGVLRDIRHTPLKTNSAFGVGLAANGAEGAPHTLHSYANISGNLAIESVLSVAAIGFADDATDSTGTTPGVFADANAADPNVGDTTAGLFAQQTQGLAMKAVYDDAFAATGGNLNAATAAKATGSNKGPYTMDLSLALLQLESGPAIATGAAAATVNAYTSATNLGTMSTDLASDIGMISVTSIAKVC